MYYRLWQIALIGLLSTLLGINYTLYTWLDYDFLGIGKGFLHSSLLIWGYVAIAIGLLTLLTLAFRKIINILMIDRQISFLLIIIFVIQLPIASLWFMSMMLHGFSAIVGTALHTILVVLIGWIFLTSHHRPQHTKQPSEEVLQ